MKFGVIAATALLVAASATTVMAAHEGPYVGLNAGTVIMHDSDLNGSGFTPIEISYDPGFAVGGVLGYETAKMARFEGEIAYRKADVDTVSFVGLGSGAADGDLAVTSYMINAYADFAKDTNLSPFVGVGVGILDGKLYDGADDYSDTTFGYQVMAGVSVKATPTVNVDLSYRYQGAASDFKVEGADLSYGSSNIIAGVRVKF